MREYQRLRKIMAEEEVLVGIYDEGEVLDSKLKVIKNWKRNRVFMNIENREQKSIHTKWVATGKMKKEK